MNRKRLPLLVAGGVLAGAIGYGVWRRAALRAASTAATRCSGGQGLTGALRPPAAKKAPHTVTVCGKEYEDPYYWMRDDKRECKEVIAHLEAENAYAEAVTKHTTDLQKALYEEYMLHLKEDDEEAPYPWGNYVYWKKTEKGKNYPIYLRARREPGASVAAEGAKPEVVVDVNKLAEGHAFFSLGGIRPSPDPQHRFVAVTMDTQGYEDYTLKIKDMETGEFLPGVVDKIDNHVEWGADASTLFYIRFDHAHRPYRLFKHTVGAPVEKDEMLFEEADELMWLGMSRSASGRFLFVSPGGKVTSETHYLDLNDPAARLTVVLPREHNHLYDVEHVNDNFWIVSNDKALNFKLVAAPIATPGKENWQEVLSYDSETKIDNVYPFRTHVVVTGRKAGLTQIQVLPLKEEGKLAALEGGAAYNASLIDAPVTLTFEEPVFTAETHVNKEFDIDRFRISYTSLVTPPTVYDVDFKTGARTLRKKKEVLHYDPSLYESERVWAVATDGVRIPISMVYRKDKRKPADNPVLLYGYGAYGISYDPEFEDIHLPLLDRGVTIAIAHIRGGGEMGRHWYELGKFLNKKNSFTDFIACAEHLIETGYTNKCRLAISGSSAGGLLMGAVLNLRPDLFKCCYTRVPFVDVLTTMSDPSIPLTVVEYEEWGNPNEEKYHEYMASYSPVNNCKPTEYPPILITTGLHDARVGYWEPMKWVQRLRDVKTDSNPVVFKTKMAAGHGGGSGRYIRYEERAFELAFVLDQITDSRPCEHPVA